MRIIKNCFYKHLTFEKLIEAHQRGKMHKVHKDEVIKFELNLENNITNILNSLKNNKYRLGKYFEFTVYEPKKRIIKALPYKDRIVQQWYVEEFIKPHVVSKFISSNFACLENKGTHKAVDQVQKYMRIYKRNYDSFWILKCDIKKFFNSIDPYVLVDIMKKYISDKKLLDFTKLIIFDGRNPNEKAGIPIGNFSSQYFANIYLNELDQFVKRVLHVKAYVRYMDDFILILKNKDECMKLKTIITAFLKDRLHLELNEKSMYYPHKMGVNFCGYRIFATHKLLRTNSKTKIKNNVKKWNKLYSENNLDIPKTLQSLNSWLGHSGHCNSYNLQNKILNNCDFLYNNKTFQQIENDFIKDIDNYTITYIPEEAVDT